MRKQKDPRSKFARWILELEPIDYIVRYRRGSDNLAADRLSRSAAEYDVLVNNEVEFFERHVYQVFVEFDVTRVVKSIFTKLRLVLKVFRDNLNSMVEIITNINIIIVLIC